MKQLKQMKSPQIVSSVCTYSYYPVLCIAFSLLGQFIFHQSYITADNKIVYCIESCNPWGYYLQWNDDSRKLSVGFYVSASILIINLSFSVHLKTPPTQPDAGASSPPPQPPSDERSICWLKIVHQPSDSVDSHVYVSTLIAYNGNDNCYVTFYSSSSPPNYVNARLTSDTKDANQMTITELM